MNKLNQGRIDKQLNKIARFSEGVMTYKDFFINHVSIIKLVLSDNMDKYDRVKFNRMDNNKDQNEYMKRLKTPVTEYRAYLKNSESFINVNSLLYEGFRQLNEGLNININ